MVKMSKLIYLMVIGMVSGVIGMEVEVEEGSGVTAERAEVLEVIYFNEEEELQEDTLKVYGPHAQEP